MTTATTKTSGFEKTPSTLAAYLFYAGGVLLAAACAAILIGACAARAQTVPGAKPTLSTSPVPAATASDAAEAPVAASSAPSPAKAAPRYSAKDIERAFGFIDANKDSKISREEASGFRNVAKYYDAADINKDGALSLDEFASALNRP